MAWTNNPYVIHILLSNSDKGITEKVINILLEVKLGKNNNILRRSNENEWWWIKSEIKHMGLLVTPELDSEIIYGFDMI